MLFADASHMPLHCGDSRVDQHGGDAKARSARMRPTEGAEADINNILWCPPVMYPAYMNPLGNPNPFYRNDGGAERFRFSTGLIERCRVVSPHNAVGIQRARVDGSTRKARDRAGYTALAGLPRAPVNSSTLDSH